MAGVIDSRVAYSVATHITQREIPFVISNAGADDLTQRRASPLIVRTSFSSSGGSHPLGVWAYEQGFRKAVAMGADNPAGLRASRRDLQDLHENGRKGGSRNLAQI